MPTLQLSPPESSDNDECLDRNAVFAALIARAAAGNAAAFDELYGLSARWLLAHVRRIVEDGQCEDVLAEVYIHVWKSLGSFDPMRAPATAWLVTIARSRSLDHLRREKRHLAFRGKEAANDAADEHHEAPDTLLSRLESMRMVQLSLETLSAQEQLVLGLAYFRECSHGEIAASTGLALGTVKSMMSRAQTKLRERLTPVRGPTAPSKADRHEQV
jgi:RNA polymerase sigma-70 factor, ECF subfamily